MFLFPNIVSTNVVSSRIIRRLLPVSTAVISSSMSTTTTVTKRQKITTSNNTNNAKSIPTNYLPYKPRIIILGSGWGGHTLAKRLDKTKFDVRVISPANHFLFTPLLPGTAVGTLEFRAIQEPVRIIPQLGEYYQAKARQLDVKKKIIHCEDIFQKEQFSVKYDYLLIAAGNKTNTYGIPGVEATEGRSDGKNSSVLFLKHLYHARLIRNRILECFERASNTNVTKKERARLLSFVVVGGGPTSCEFTTELYDFIHEDVSKWYPDLKEDIKLTLVEAGSTLLSGFHQSLSNYYLTNLQKRNVDVKLCTAVTGVHERQFTRTPPPTNDEKIDDDRCKEKTKSRKYTYAKFNDDTELPFGMMVWSAGLAPVKFVEESGLSLLKGRIEVDEYLRVPNCKGRVFAFGDCGIITHVNDPDGLGALPPTASVAEQQAYYLSDCFNDYYHEFNSTIGKSNNNDGDDNYDDDQELPLPGPVVPALLPYGGFVAEYINSKLCQSSPKFMYKNRGAMAGMGFGGGVSDLTNTDLPFAPKTATSGLAAFLMWRSVYLTKQVSGTNMILIPMYWFKQMLFGRDISRF
mmetsp:Transcript_28569/g.32059  ORF Transcript_28569/g.32059 Transcript_28569/m.32059 type:complete len:575 (-) Transcript_28569:92-1816(-)